jgi:hypothetical protein
LSGLTDSEIRAVVGRALAKRPRYRLVLHWRNAAVLLGMAVAVVVLPRYAGLDSALALLFIGVVATAVVLGWNLIWVNTVLFRLTAQEMRQRS